MLKNNDEQSKLVFLMDLILEKNYIYKLSFNYDLLDCMYIYGKVNENIIVIVMQKY